MFQANQFLSLFYFVQFPPIVPFNYTFKLFLSCFFWRITFCFVHIYYGGNVEKKCQYTRCLVALAWIQKDWSGENVGRAGAPLCHPCIGSRHAAEQWRVWHVAGKHPAAKKTVWKRSASGVDRRSYPWSSKNLLQTFKIYCGHFKTFSTPKIKLWYWTWVFQKNCNTWLYMFVLNLQKQCYEQRFLTLISPWYKVQNTSGYMMWFKYVVVKSSVRLSPWSSYHFIIVSVSI